jgi:uncharacterized membrane protein
MPFCRACGQEVGNANFCPKCGASQTATSPSSAVPADSPTEGLQENVAGLLCYLLGWLTGLIFLLIDKRPWVRFQAAQSIAVFGGLTVIRIVLVFVHGFFVFFWMVIGLLGFVLWIVLMVKAYQHQTWRVPIAADIADSLLK